MKTVAVIYTQDYAALGARIQADLEAAGFAVANSVQSGSQSLAVLILAPEALNALEPALLAALDNNQHVLPVLAKPVRLPYLINNLAPFDFSAGYDGKALVAEVQRLTAPGAPRPITVLTPSRREANRRTGLMLIIPVVIMFIVAVVGVMLNITVPPTDEFAGIETQIFLTRNYFIDQALPNSTDEALGFMATVEQYNGTVQPFLILTATGVANRSESTFYPRSTEDAQDFPATLERVSTMVQDRMAATVTQLAVTAAAITPTPTVEAETTPEATPEAGS